MTDFEKNLKENKKCPLCKKDLIFIHGCGWDYDMEYCTDRVCKYEHEYDTSTVTDEKELD